MPVSRNVLPRLRRALTTSQRPRPAQFASPHCLAPRASGSYQSALALGKGPDSSADVRFVPKADIGGRNVRFKFALALVHDERCDFTWIGKDHIRAVASHSSSNQGRGILFGAVATRVSL